MANISVRKQDGGSQQQLPRMPGWDPVSWARDLLRWDPLREMLPSSFSIDVTSSFSPPFEIKENREAFVFKADVPGMGEKDLDITRTGHRLTISGKRESEREEKGDTFYALERAYGSFARSFTLPEGVDDEHIQADLREGVLTIIAPKLPGSPQKIAIKASEKRS
jgi:HSP20 family protein